MKQYSESIIGERIHHKNFGYGRVLEIHNGIWMSKVEFDNPLPEKYNDGKRVTMVCNEDIHVVNIREL